MKISDKEIASILAEVEAELAPLLRSERQRLSKAGEGSASPMGEESRSPGRDMMPDERSGSASGSPEGSASGSPMGSPEGSSASGSPMPEGSSASGSPEMSGGSPEGSAGGGDVQELASQYAQLSPEDLESHLMAIEMAMQQMQGGAAGGAPAGMPPEAGGAGMPPAAQAGAMPPPEGSPTMKSEKLSKGMFTWAPYTTLHHVATQHEKEHGAGAWDKEHPEMTVAHIKENMEKEHSAVKERSASREKSASASASVEKSAGSFGKSELDAVNAKLDVALKAVEFLTRPMRKAVTEFAVVETKAASSMTKGEVTAKLKEVTSSPTLAKSDRNLVNGFYDGRISLDQIAHLLK